MRTRPIDLSRHLTWPGSRRIPRDERTVAERFPIGEQRSWGIPFSLPSSRRLIAIRAGDPEVVIALRGRATHLCFLQDWVDGELGPSEEPARIGLMVAEYELAYRDGSRHVQPVRARYELPIPWDESPGPAWVALPWRMPEPIDPELPAGSRHWAASQDAVEHQTMGRPVLFAMINPHPRRPLRSLIIRGRDQRRLLVAGLTLFEGSAHPLQHLPRRRYRVQVRGRQAKVLGATLDLGVVARVEQAHAPRDRRWLAAPGTVETPDAGEQVLHLTGARDATVSVSVEHSGRAATHEFSLSEAFERGRSSSDGATLSVLDRRRRWLRVRVIDRGTGRPTAARIHFSGPRGDYVAPYGHHEQINCASFEDYGADVRWGGRSFAYVSGDFTSDLPVGELYVEISKGFEYAPVRRRIAVRPGQQELTLEIERWIDLRSRGWVTADTHVHFISPHTAALEARAEGVNVVNLLAMQSGRLFTNVGDLRGHPNVVEDDTIVFVATENRHHLLGHISMLGTTGPLPVYPMSSGGPSEAWIGDPEVKLLAEWARENRDRGGVVIGPHFPFCGYTENPLPIMQGLIDAVEVDPGYFLQIPEWYRYLNAGYRVAICDGTDKMSASSPIGWKRTYAKLDPRKPFTYQAWAGAVKAGRTVSTSGPLMDMTVDDAEIGGKIRMSASGGTVEVHAWAECFDPLEYLELVRDGEVVARVDADPGQRRLEIRQRLAIASSGWIAARCQGSILHGHQRKVAAHTSPVYITCGGKRPFDGEAIEHLHGLVSGGLEYMRSIATCYDEATRRRMVRQLKQAQADLKVRLIREGRSHRHADGTVHAHGAALSTHRH